jgi:hypothetical protein
MFKNLFKMMLLLSLGLLTLNASVVNDGFEELEKGNVLEAANIFQNSCNKVCKLRQLCGGFFRNHHGQALITSCR